MCVYIDLIVKSMHHKVDVKISKNKIKNTMYQTKTSGHGLCKALKKRKKKKRRKTMNLYYENPVKSARMTEELCRALWWNIFHPHNKV